MIEISKIEEILPQTQCRQCGYHDCADYARGHRRRGKA
ncbi:MAG: (Fe-S)-binding protein [Parasutterella sp.]